MALKCLTVALSPQQYGHQQQQSTCNSAITGQLFLSSLEQAPNRKHQSHDRKQQQQQK